MPNQNLQILVMILVINVVMSSIGSSSCFRVNVPCVNLNANETTLVNSVGQLLTLPISERADKRSANCRYGWTALTDPVPVTRGERICII